LRVVDMADEKGELCGRLLADLGADVLRIEPAGGARSRRLPPFHEGTSLYFTVRNSNKRCLALDLGTVEGTARLRALLAEADVWIESCRPGELAELGLDPASVAAELPNLVIASITDFGLSGPYRDFHATDPVMMALSWMLFRSGEIEWPPVLPPGALAYDVVGITAAFAVLAACRQQLTSGAGQHLDVSVMESVAQTTDWSLSGWSVAERLGQPFPQLRSGAGPVYPIIPCADGYVRPSMITVTEWRNLRGWMGDPPELVDPVYDSTMGRVAAYDDVIEPALVAFFRDRTMIAAAIEGQQRGVPITPFLAPHDVLQADHFVATHAFAEAIVDGAVAPLAAGFYLFDGARVGFRGTAATVDARAAVWASASRPFHRAVEGAGGARGGAAPFDGLRVLDLGVAGAAPEVARLFAEYGADVVRIESATRPDVFRALGGPTGIGAPFVSSNRTKRSFGVDFKRPEGAALVLELARHADVVVENLPPGTLERFGIGWEAFRAANPDIVIFSSQSMGMRGPWSTWRGYGANTQTPTGMSYLWSFPEAPEPVGSNVAFPDHVVGRLGAVAVAACALADLRRGRPEGRHIEVSQAEACINLLADVLAQEGLRPGSAAPLGNRSERGYPWGLYPCDGFERWCAITVRDDDDWRRLVEALGQPEWALHESYDTLEGRRIAWRAIELQLAGWTATRSDREVMATLQEHGVPAGAMLYPGDLAADPHLRERGFIVEIDQPDLGPVLLEGAAFRGDGVGSPLITPAPLLGEHTRDVCTEVLGMDPDEVDRLLAEGLLFASEPALDASHH
jgi:crotonobetainyl-CoA:carnitine CoA-transferase CaiB-like acyl-CoA transferase